MKQINKASKVSNLLKKHPDWSVAKIAEQAGCAANYVYMVRTKMRKNVLELTKDQEVTDQMEPLENEASNALLHSISQGKGRGSDLVNSPTHYMSGGIETIDFIKAKLSDEEFTGYLKGNVIKYVTRAELKDNRAQDLAKAKWYMDRLVQ
jgi:hypothetical protein